MVNDLIYWSPEEEGLKSEEILRFLDSIDFNRRNIHSLMIVRHGKILFETYAKNFNKDYLSVLDGITSKDFNLFMTNLVGYGNQVDLLMEGTEDDVKTRTLFKEDEFIRNFFGY